MARNMTPNRVAELRAELAELRGATTARLDEFERRLERAERLATALHTSQRARAVAELATLRRLEDPGEPERTAA